MHHAPRHDDRLEALDENADDHEKAYQNPNNLHGLLLAENRSAEQ